MAGREGEKAGTSFVEKYEQAKKEKPLLRKLTDSIWFENFPPEGTITDTGVSKALWEISAREKYRLLELCKKDVDLSEAQVDVLKEVLSKAIVGCGIKPYLPGDDLVTKTRPELLLIAATYINSLRE